MKKTLLSKALKSISNLLFALTSFSVNSACVITLGQDKEPESLKRLSKIKN